MSDPRGASFRLKGQLGASATAIVGSGNELSATTHNHAPVFNLQLSSPTEAQAVLKGWWAQEGRRQVRSPLRLLDPIVLVNRQAEIEAIAAFLNGDDASVLFLVGFAGIGKSTLARGGLELRAGEIPAVWVDCSGLSADLLAEHVRRELEPDASPDPTYGAAAAIPAMLQTPCVVVLDGLEALLDDKDDFASPDMVKLLTALRVDDHRGKIIVTTRRLPKGIGKGTPRVVLLKISGLSLGCSKELFALRAGQSVAEVEAEIPATAFARLHGHPKFIELVANSLELLPVAEVVGQLQQSTGIADYIDREVVGRLEPAAREVLEVASIFRGIFAYEALKQVYGRLHGGAPLAAATVLALSRRAILDRAEGDRYYLHPLLAAAFDLPPEQAARTHAAAAAALLPGKVTLESVGAWDEGLYHLRQAAEIGASEEFFRPYFEFVRERGRAVGWAGFPRRRIEELRAVGELASEPEDLFIVWLDLSQCLREAGERGEALEILRNLAVGTEDLPERPETDDEKAMAAIAARLKVEIGQVTDDLEEARRMAAEAAPWVEAVGALGLRIDLAALRFENERRAAVIDPARLLAAAEAYFAVTQESDEDTNARAEAYFALAVANISTGNTEAVITNLGNQLRAKVALRNLPGVSAGLWNVGAVSRVIWRELSIAALVACGQMEREFGGDHVEAPELIDEANAAVAEDAALRDRCLEILAEISPDLPPYFERAVRGM